MRIAADWQVLEIFALIAVIALSIAAVWFCLRCLARRRHAAMIVRSSNVTLFRAPKSIKGVEHEHRRQYTTNESGGGK